MSYGEWRKRGKGWSSIEIDSPRNRQIYDLVSESAKRDIEQTAYIYNIPCSSVSNPAIIRFKINAKRKVWNCIEFALGGGHHSTWIAFENKEALREALTKNLASADEINLAMRRLEQ